MADTTQTDSIPHATVMNVDARNSINSAFWLVLGAVLAFGVVWFILSGGFEGEGLGSRAPGFTMEGATPQNAASAVEGAADGN